MEWATARGDLNKVDGGLMLTDSIKSGSGQMRRKVSASVQRRDLVRRREPAGREVARERELLG